MPTAPLGIITLFVQACHCIRGDENTQVDRVYQGNGRKPVHSAWDNICLSGIYILLLSWSGERAAFCSWKGLNLDYGFRFPHLRSPAKVPSESQDEGCGLRAEEAAGGCRGGDATEREARGGAFPHIPLTCGGQRRKRDTRSE